VSARSVVVIGGGLAGIAAAVDCASAGAGVTLLESRGRLGGAAYSFARDGLPADNGQHVFLRCCTAYVELLERLGARDLVTVQPRLEITVLAPGGRRGRLGRSGLPAPLHLAGALLRYPFLSLGERLRVAQAMQALRRVDVDDPAADARSFGDWLRAQRQSPRAVAALWELITRPTLNLTCDDASLAQAAYVFQVGLLADAAAGDVGHARVPLSEIHDVAARRALDAAGVDVRLRSGAATVEPGFTVTVAGSGDRLSADAVIVAVGHERAAKLLPAEARVDGAALGRLGRSPIVNLHVIYDRPVLDVPFAAGVDTPVQWVFDRTASAGLTGGGSVPDGSQYLAVTLSAADDELAVGPDELRARYLPALAELLPGAREAAVERFFVTREHAATFRAAPGTRALRPPARTALPGLALAGAYTDTGWPATMEGAVRSGHSAATLALSAPRQDAADREASRRAASAREAVGT
jgi:squalene-associated FAD-dependent desaturase